MVKGEQTGSVRFPDWCKIERPRPVVKGRRLRFLTNKPNRFKAAVKAVSEIIPENYVNKDYLADIFNRLGKEAAAAKLREKLPDSPGSRSGDIGEILAAAYINEATGFRVPVGRLWWKDHQNMPMRGEDVIAIKVTDSGRLRFLKGEAKSRKKMPPSVISEAGETLLANDELPTPHALGLVAERLRDRGETELAHRIEEAYLLNQISVSQVSHLLFSFSGNDTRNLLKKHIEEFSGKARQLTVGLRVSRHQEFIKAAYEEALKDGS